MRAKRLKPQPAVVSLNPLTLDDVLQDILTIGDALGLAAEVRSFGSHRTREFAPLLRRACQRKCPQHGLGVCVQQFLAISLLSK